MGSDQLVGLEWLRHDAFPPSLEGHSKQEQRFNLSGGKISQAQPFQPYNLGSSRFAIDQ